MIISMLDSDCDQFVVLPSSGTRGGVLLTWKVSASRAVVRVCCWYLRIALVQFDGSAMVVHGHPIIERFSFCKSCETSRTRVELPQALGNTQLEDISIFFFREWGDFNLIYMVEEKNRVMIGRFWCFLWYTPSISFSFYKPHCTKLKLSNFDEVSR